VPEALVVSAGWAWRLLVLGVAGYLAVRILALLWIPSLAVVLAVLFTALLRPITTLLRRGLPGPLASILTLLLAVGAVAGTGYLVDLRVTQQLPQLSTEVVDTVDRVRRSLQSAGITASLPQVDEIGQDVVSWVQQHQGDLLSYLGTGVQVVVDLATVVVLALFVTFFLLHDGERVWRWLLGRLPAGPARRAQRAGELAWATLTGYVHGTAVIAIIHGIVIGGVASLLGVPLAAPLGLIVFLGSFLPIVGALLGGGIAVLVTLGTQGWAAALILFAVLVVEDQLEAHLLQPLIVGRYVRLHPLAIGLALAVGTVLGGVVGALVAVPVAAIVYRVGPTLVRRGPDRRVDHLGAGSPGLPGARTLRGDGHHRTTQPSGSADSRR
jgi:predicted PurR-regulated permease PerM